MRRRWPWTVLKIDPTNDVSAVRSAYATILKSFDPDDDLPRFEKLRDARDEALRLARSGSAIGDAQGEDNDEDEQGDEYGDEVDFDWSGNDWHYDGPFGGNAAPVVRLGAAVDPAHADHTDRPDEATGQQAAIEAHYAALMTLLTPDGEDEYLPDPADSEAMREHFAALLADPRMDNVTFRARADEHFLYTLANSVPHSDAILTMAADAFGWPARRGRVGEPRTLDWLLDRADEVRQRSPLYEQEVLRLRHDMETPGHPDHVSWMDLTGRALDDGSLTNPDRRRTVALLSKIEQYYPPLLAGVDPDRAHHWHVQAEKAQARKQRFVMIGCFLFMVVVLSLGRLFPPPHDTGPRPVLVMPPVDVQRLSDEDADLERVLASRGSGISVKQVAADNPTLYAELTRRWREAKARGDDFPSFRAATQTFLKDQFAANFPRASRADITVYWQVQLNRLRAVKAMSAELCSAEVLGKDTVPPPLPPTDNDRLLALEGRVLTTVPYIAGATWVPKRYTIPGEVVAAATKRSGLTIKTFSDALDGTGAPAAICAARIGLIEAAIATPGKLGDKLLRSM